ncbi:hypothetical protein Pla110_22400 [Polystyrenella longa]|uniref:Uncharacterized protein n=1 Tax=Polystyrenella longa TaxID=2528007 RepID=A0A518CMR1_9PLAN|nr:hypothetical protein [Polystyrenella longa]QDU80510.1 hypothetical protein Pla110_22400 [Polystyrenella longa]
MRKLNIYRSNKKINTSVKSKADNKKEEYSRRQFDEELKYIAATLAEEDKLLKSHNTKIGRKASCSCGCGFKVKKCRKRNETIYKWLRDRTSSYCIGELCDGTCRKCKDAKAEGKEPAPHPRPSNTKRQVMNSHKGKFRCRTMRNAHYDKHFESTETRYFAGNDEAKTSLTLIGIDIDCKHKGSDFRGTLEGAVAFAKWLKKNVFPDMYYEISTNGNGVHGYVVLNKGGGGAEYINGLLKRLQAHLRKLLLEKGFDVGDVEVKGMLPVRKWGEKKGQLLSYKSGGLIKLPRERHRFDELKDTTIVETLDLLKLPVVEQKSTLPKSSVTKTSKGGSISGKLFIEEELAKLNGHYLRCAEALLGKEKLKVNGKNRSTVSAEYLAVYLMLGKYFTENMNSDGSLPWLRWSQTWNAVYEEQDISIEFNTARNAACRRYLDSLGLISWQDNTFAMGVRDDDGKVLRKGRAMRWQFDEVLMQLLEAQEQETGCEIGDSSSRGGGGTSLCVTRFHSLLESIDFIPPEQRNVPEMVELDYYERLRYILVDEIISPIEGQLILAA